MIGVAGAQPDPVKGTCDQVVIGNASALGGRPRLCRRVRCYLDRAVCVAGEGPTKPTSPRWLFSKRLNQWKDPLVERKFLFNHTEPLLTEDKLFDPGSLASALDGISAVIHLAAGLCMPNTDFTWAILKSNLKGTRNSSLP